MKFNRQRKQYATQFYRQHRKSYITIFTKSILLHQFDELDSSFTLPPSPSPYLRVFLADSPSSPRSAIKDASLASGWNQGQSRHSKDLKRTLRRNPIPDVIYRWLNLAAACLPTGSWPTRGPGENTNNRGVCDSCWKTQNSKFILGRQVIEI